MKLFGIHITKHDWRAQAEKTAIAAWHAKHGVTANKPQERRDNGRFGQEPIHIDVLRQVAGIKPFDLNTHLEGRHETVN